MNKLRTAAVFIAVAFSLGAIAISWKQDLRTIIGTDGPKAGIQNAQQRFIATGDVNALFDLAWSRFVNGQLSQSDALSDKILYEEEWEVNDSLLAKVYFLKGSIAQERGSETLALKLFDSSASLYEKMGNYQGLFRTNMVLARTYINLGDLEKAETILQDSLPIAEENDIELGVYYSVKAQIHFSYTEWRDALELDIKAYEAFRSRRDETNMISSLSNIAMNVMLLGDYERGLALTIEAEERALALENPDAVILNRINMIYYQRCLGKILESNRNIHIIEKDIRRFIERENDMALAWFFEFVQIQGCADFNSFDVESLGEEARGFFDFNQELLATDGLDDEDTGLIDRRGDIPDEIDFVGQPTLPPPSDNN